MNIGSLYEIKKWYWLLFPSKDIAAAVDGAPAVGVAATGVQEAATMLAITAAAATAYWSKRLNNNVSYIAQNSIFMLLEQDGKYCKILTTNGELGWIIYPKDAEWAKGCIEEVNQ
jgi:hypothetical protein